MLPIDQLAPDPAIKLRERVDVSELVASIETQGVLQPLLVRPAVKAPQKLFHVVAGVRRFLAAQKVGLRAVPAVVKQLSDADAFLAALVENVQRDALDEMDEARAYQRFVEAGWGNQQDLAHRIGKSETYVSRRLSLVKRDPIAEALSVATSQLSPSHKEQLARLEKVEQLKEIAGLARKEQLSAHETREVVNMVKGGVDPVDAVATIVEARPKGTKPEEAAAIVQSATAQAQPAPRGPVSPPAPPAPPERAAPTKAPDLAALREEVLEALGRLEQLDLDEESDALAQALHGHSLNPQVFADALRIGLTGGVTWAQLLALLPSELRPATLPVTHIACPWCEKLRFPDDAHARTQLQQHIEQTHVQKRFAADMAKPLTVEQRVSCPVCYQPSTARLTVDPRAPTLQQQVEVELVKLAPNPHRTPLHVRQALGRRP